MLQAPLDSVEKERKNERGRRVKIGLIHIRIEKVRLYIDLIERFEIGEKRCPHPHVRETRAQVARAAIGLGFFLIKPTN